MGDAGVCRRQVVPEKVYIADPKRIGEEHRRDGTVSMTCTNLQRADESAILEWTWISSSNKPDVRKLVTFCLRCISIEGVTCT